MAPVTVTQQMERYRVQQAGVGNATALRVAREVATRLDIENIDRTFWEMVERLLGIIRDGRTVSYQLARTYYLELREAEEPPPPIEEPEFPFNPVVASLVWSGPRYAKSLLRRGRTENIGQVVGASMGRAAMRQSLGAGRTTVINAVRDDRAATGWARITDSDPCDFCEMLAGRGAVYKSAETAGQFNRWHDGCACSVIPYFN